MSGDFDEFDEDGNLLRDNELDYVEQEDVLTDMKFVRLLTMNQLLCRAGGIKKLDGSFEHCDRNAVAQGLCRKHRASLFACCGGNDETPPQHTEDCSEQPCHD